MFLKVWGRTLEISYLFKVSISFIPVFHLASVFKLISFKPLVNFFQRSYSMILKMFCSVKSLMVFHFDQASTQHEKIFGSHWSQPSWCEVILKLWGCWKNFAESVKVAPELRRPGPIFKARGRKNDREDSWKCFRIILKNGMQYGNNIHTMSLKTQISVGGYLFLQDITCIAKSFE